MNSYSYPSFVSALAFLLIGLFALLKSNSRARAAFATLCLLTVVWQLSWGVLFTVEDEQTALMIVKFGYAGIIFIPLMYYHAIVRTCQVRATRLTLFYIIALAFLALHLASNQFIDGVYSYFWGYYPRAGAWHPAYLIFISIVLGLGLIHLTRSWRSEQNVQALTKIRYIAVSYVLYCCAAIDFAANYGIEMYPPGVFFIATSLAITAYAIAKHNVLDIHFVLKQTAYYSTILAILIVPCVLIIYLAEQIQQPWIRYAVYTALLVLVGFGFPRIKMRADRRLDHLLFGRAVDYRGALEKLSRKMATLQKVDTLLAEVTEVMAAALEVDGMAIYLRNDAGDYDLQVRFGNYEADGTTIKSNQITSGSVQSIDGGDLAIGERTSGSHATNIGIRFEGQLIGIIVIQDAKQALVRAEERLVLSTMAHQIAVALSNCLQFSKIQLLNERLEKSVQERTRELQRAYDELKQLALEKDEFFSRISHELRTPLTNIILPIQSVLDERGDLLATDNRLEKEAMLRNASVLLKRINDILDIAKLELGRTKVKVAPTDLAKVLRDVVSAMTPAAKRAGVSVELILDVKSMVYVDADKLERVVANLLNNAIKFTEAPGRVVVMCRESEDGVRVSIADTGIGISAEDINKIFQPFHQVERSANRRYEGTGLGLAICKELIELHQGSIAVESVLGKGSTFTIALKKGRDHFANDQIVTNEWPVVNRRVGERRTSRIFRDAQLNGWDISNKRADETERPKTNRPAPLAAASGKHKIVLVEDNHDLAANLTKILSAQYDVTGAEDGMKGLRTARRERPEVIIADIMMPIMDGYTLCREIKADPELSTIQIILLSAKSSVDDKVEGIRRGADAYLTKPFAPKELIATVDALLVKRKLQMDLIEKNDQLERAKNELEKAMALAQEASRAKSAFLSSMSHELRTPLNAIIGYTELVSESMQSEGVTQYTGDLDKINASGRHLLTLVNNVLDLAKVEAGKMEVLVDTVRIDDMVSEVMALCETTARKNNNKLVYASDRQPASIYTDATKVKQVLVNIVSNACKFTTNGSITIESRVDNPDGKAILAFTIRDTGIGMTTEQVENLFVEFYQANAPVARNHVGTGLGLVISRRICQLMGGDIRVTSEVGVGSTFMVTIPVTVREASKMKAS